MIFRTKKPQTGPQEKSAFSKHKQEALSRKVTFAVDRDMKKIETIVVPMILSNNKLTKDTHIISFEELLSNDPPITSDVLIIRSSRMFHSHQDKREELKDAIRKFKKANPKSVVFVFAIGYAEEMASLKAQNVVDEVFYNNQAGKDIETVAKALKLLETRQAE